MTTAPQQQRVVLYAIYDLGRSPVTFDVMNFFVLAHIWARRGGFAGIHPIFVLGDNGSFRNITPKDAALSIEEKFWRLWHVLLPHAAIAASCVGVSYVYDRAELARLMRALHPKQVFPPNYTVERPNHAFMLNQIFRLNPKLEELDVFRPTPAALAKVDAWLAGREANDRPVVITLRSSGIEPHRNSRLDEWRAAAADIADRGFSPVIVPDTDLVTAGTELSAFGGLPVFGLAAIDLDLRLALFRRASLNLADNGGPAFLNFFMADSTLICFLPVDKLPTVVGPEGTSMMAQLLGVKPDGDFPHANATRRFVWRPDRRDAIIEEFDRAVAGLEAAGNRGNSA